MEWWALLDQFARSRSRMELEGASDAGGLYVADRAYLSLEQKRLERIAALRRERGMHSLQHKTGLRILASRPTVNGITADIQLDHQFYYRLNGRDCREDRIERKRIFLTAAAGEWIISRVQTEGERGLEAGAGGFENHDSSIPPVGAERGTAGDGSAAEIPAAGFPASQDEGGAASGFVEPARAYYDRARAVAYADRWWNSYNPAYVPFEVDCSSYVSQCLFAGGAPMNYTGNRGSGWWYRGKSGNQELWSYSWSVANSLRLYLSSSRSGLRAVTVGHPSQLEPGDVISYSWDGDGRFGHSTIVTAMAADGMPLVNAHTVNSRYRYWDYRDSYAWTERTVYRFFHIQL